MQNHFYNSVFTTELVHFLAFHISLMLKRRKNDRDLRKICKFVENYLYEATFYHTCISDVLSIVFCTGYHQSSI